MLDQLLSKHENRKLIQYRDTSMTDTEFSERVNLLTGAIPSAPERFYLIATENPIELYTILFAAWKADAKVIFPTRDHFQGKKIFPHYTHVIQYNDEKIQITENPDFTEVEAMEKIDFDTIIFSSGSTGTPKGIVHVKKHFFDNARETASAMGLSGFTGITMLKPYLMSALSHFLVHYITESFLIFSDFDHIDSLPEILEKNENCSILGSPMHILMSLAKIKPNYKPAFFFTSGDFIYKNSITSILSKFPEAVFFKVYGLAELGGRFFIQPVNSSMAPELIDGIGNCIEGMEYETREGQLYVKSDFLFQGYIRNGIFDKSIQWHATGDIVKTDHGVMVLAGRSDDEIKVGGNKVSLKHIEGKVTEIFPETGIAVVPQEHPTLGNLICLVFEGDCGIGRSELIKKLKGKLENNELPHKYYTMENFPFTQTMKIDRKEIGRLLKDLKPL
ncbi:MAG: class I adenylate-forming enzyme family protein [Leptospirales bacterium]